MKTAKISAEKVDELLVAARRQYDRVMCPVKRGTTVVIDEPREGETWTSEIVNTDPGPKDVFFPQTEVLCEYEGEKLSAVPLPDQRTLVFGMRPCDARALLCLDKVFGEFGGASDPYYVARRQGSLVVALACRRLGEGCFCEEVGGDPAGAEGADVGAVHIGGALVLEAQTAAGEAFLEACSPLLTSASAHDLKARDTRAAEARRGGKPLDLDRLATALRESFDDPVWEKLSEVCLGCGLCTYQCPTCHCFDISDERRGAAGKRVRIWDSCQYELFTRHASGHNPRPARTARMRQRLLHKFLYTVDNMARVFCVGCGRCVRHCPVNLDIREMLQKLSPRP